MRFRGIDYNVKQTIERGVWVWEVQLPKTSREGKFTGTREEATAHAKRLLWEWCYRNPGFCAPLTAEEVPYDSMMRGRMYQHAKAS